jgi:hypothetical protein
VSKRKRTLVRVGTPNLSCETAPLTLCVWPTYAIDSSGSDKVILGVFHDGIVDECIGRIEIDMRTLLERQHQSSENGECLVLMSFTASET